MWNSNDYKLVIQFSIRETVCTKISGRDPFTCDFKIGPFVPSAFCRSVVIVSEEQITNMVVQCHQDMFSSESISSEEVRKETTCLFAPETFPSRRGSSSYGNWRKRSYVSSDKTE
uniref:Secreted phosphoprotein 24 n=1 Tax=Nothoprocta perdicaria TaxID=30464 RepID=A0A8C6ZYB1_NOTPE